MARPVLLLAILVFAALSGCTSTDGGPDGAKADVPVITDPLDYSYLQNATPGSHIHDYWQGRGQVTVLEDEGGSFSSSCSGCTDGMTVSSRSPPDGAIVPQGTKWVNGTVTFRPDGENTWTRLELWVRTAEDNEAQRWGDIQSGVPFSINSTLERNDPPHYVLSLWEFSVKAYGASGDIRMAGGLDWSVVAVRGLPLVPFPPHPDRWNGASELDLLKETQSSMLTMYQQTPNGGQSYSCYSGCPTTHRLGDDVVVPFDTGRVEVRISYGPGMPAGLGLSYHGANTRTLTHATGSMESPGVTLFSIPVQAGEADSPYAKQSLWEFDVWLEYPQDPPVQVWTGEYTVAVKAVKA